MTVRKDDFIKFLFRVKEGLGEFGQVIVPRKVMGDDTCYTVLKNDIHDEIIISLNRTTEPVKFLFYTPRETVYPYNKLPIKRLLVGIAACDLQALLLMDKALLEEEFTEPAYHYWRENTTIITTDCTEIKDSCHCTLQSGNPFSEIGFDVNLSESEGNYTLTAGTTRGEELLSLIKTEITSFNNSNDNTEKTINIRKSVFSALYESNKAYLHSEVTSKMREVDMQVWEEASAKCVGCGSCTNVCPTCYCLILNEDSENNSFIKSRTYDSCQYSGYARVAGGSSPRPAIAQRFRNRYLCKFDYMNHNFGISGCTGCGRCIESCPAGIDIREVTAKLKTANMEVESTHQ